MPDPTRFPMQLLPDYHFNELDELLAVLDEISDETLREEIRDALADRELDVESLAAEHSLPRHVLNRLEQLQDWGSDDLCGQPFGSVVLATVSGACSSGRIDYVAYLFARRDDGRIVYSMSDDAGGDADLAESTEPLTLREMIQLVDRFLAENAPWATDPSDWLAGYWSQK